MPHMFSDVRSFRRDPLAFLLERGSRSNEPLARLHLGPTPAYLVADAELVKPILKAPEDRINKGFHMRRLMPVLGVNSLTLRSGPDHELRRQALHSVLAKGVIDRLVPFLSAEIRRTAAEAAALETFDAREIGAPLALRLVSLAVFGRDALAPADEQALVAVIHELEADIADEMFRMVPLWPWEARRRRKAREAGRRTLLDIVSRVRTRAGEGSAVQALDRVGLNEQEMADEVLMLLVAGHHTTGSNFAWAMHRLALEPELLRELREEAAGITDASGEINAEGLRDASISLAFCKELLRLYPSSWWYAREAQQTMEVGGREVKKGSWLIVCPWHMHRDPKYWPEPDVMRLDRAFSSKAWIPFGVGPRACTGIGLAMIELQLLTLEFATAFDLTTTAPIDVAPIAQVTLLPPAISITAKPAGRQVGRQAAAA